MKRVKRIGTLLVSIGTATLLSFGLGALAPGDPALVRAGGTGNAVQSADFERRYLAARRELGLDLPLFYFSVVPLSFPDTFERVAFDRNVLTSLLYRFGDWDGVMDYYQKLRAVSIDDDSIGYWRKALTSATPPIRDAARIPEFLPAVQAWRRLEKHPRRWRNYVPRFRFHGTQCRYHRWLTTSGESYRDFRPVREKMGEAVARTLGLNLAALSLGAGLGLMTALWIVRRPRFEAWIVNLCFGLYSVPTFWAGTVLITLFAGGLWNVLPSHGWRSPGFSADLSPGMLVADVAAHLVMPLICLTYPIWAFWTLQWRESLTDELKRPYVLAHRAWGLSEKRILNPMTLKNVAAPAAALVAASVPAILTGSIVVETLFSLPGMGLLAYEAVLHRDYPVLTAVFTFSATLTLVANFFADEIVARLDPRSKIA